MLWFLLAMSCFDATRNCSDGGLRGVFPERDDLLPATESLAVTVGYGEPWTNCGLDGWDSATYVLSGDVQGELADGEVALEWPGDVFWMALSAPPLHEEVLTLHFNGDTGDGAWIAEVDTGLTLEAATPTSVTLDAPTITSQTVDGRTYVSLIGAGSAEVDLDGLLIQTLTTDVVYGPDDVATSGEVVLSSTRASGDSLVWATGYVGIEDGAAELCIAVRGVDIDQVERFRTETECWTL